MTRRYYSSIAAPTTLTAGINSSTTSVPVTAVTGFPSSYPYTIILDKDTASEEIITVTSRSGLTLTATRGVGGTTGVAHSSGGTVTHGVYDADFEDAAAHVAETTTAHGLTLTNVLTTTNTKSVTNKTLDSTNVIAQAAVTNLTTDLAAKIAASIVDAKGDVIVATAADTVSRLAVGANGKALTAASGEATGAKWAYPGMALVTSAAVSGAASVSIDSCFTTAFQSYILRWVGVGSSDQVLRMRLRASAADNSTSNYSNDATISSVTGGSTHSAASGQDAAWVGRNGTTGVNRATVEIDGPQEATYTAWTTRSVATTDSAYTTMVSGVFAATTQFDGVKLYPDAGTLTGTLFVYGIANA